MLVPVAEARVDWPEILRVAAETLPEAVRLVPEAFVKFRVGKVPWPVTEMFVPEALVKVKPWRAAAPEIVMLVEETLVEETLAAESSPANRAVPVAETMNWVEEFTWKFRKSPEKPAGLMPM